jgi:hypothetical protein
MFSKGYHPPEMMDLSTATHTLTYCQGTDGKAVCGGDAVGLFQFPSGSALFSTNAGTSGRRGAKTADLGNNTRVRQSTKDFQRKAEYVSSG